MHTHKYPTHTHIHTHMTDLPSKAVEMMVRWVYSGDLHSGQGGGEGNGGNEGLLVDLLHCSHRFQLHPLKNL